MAWRDGEKKLRMRGHPDWSLELLPLWLYEEGMKKKYWSNVCAMLGVALIATAFFQEHWFWGTALGAYSLFWGAKWWEA